ncbi:MAG: hypothetical protein GY845_09810 [Planctomycetes bacterium]|nr:hypothetical protein [Planctomycetota bacterium]
MKWKEIELAIRRGWSGQQSLCRWSRVEFLSVRDGLKQAFVRGAVMPVRSPGQASPLTPAGATRGCLCSCNDL